MGVFDSVRDSIHGGSSDNSASEASGRDRDGFDSSQFDDSFDSDPGEPRDPRNSPHSPEKLDSPGGGQNRQAGDRNGQFQGQAGSSRGQQRQELNSQQGRQQSAPRDSPNPQAGRPREGDSSPQLSRQTERKMENAGLQPQDSRKQSVADRRDDLEELKAQNEQIIELLKRINSSLSGGRHGGRR